MYICLAVYSEMADVLLFISPDGRLLGFVFSIHCQDVSRVILLISCRVCEARWREATVLRVQRVSERERSEKNQAPGPSRHLRWVAGVATKQLYLYLSGGTMHVHVLTGWHNRSEEAKA